jgi:Domain of unknown function(DUF2779)
MPPISKSRLLAHRQCPKSLWLQVNQPELLAESGNTQASYAAGNRLGVVAQQIFDPNAIGQTFNVMADGVQGVMVQTQTAIAETGSELKYRPPLFEAGFEAAGTRAFVDVLLPVLGPAELPPRWAIVEVKSATSMKDVYLEDAAIQYFAATQAGLDLDSIYIAHVDNAWVYQGDENYDGLLTTVDVTQEIQELVLCLPQWIKKAQATLKRRKAPAVTTGAQCNSPYPCGFLAHCQSSEPAVAHPVQWLPRVQTKALREHLARPTVKEMRDVPDELLNPQQLRVKKATVSGRAWLDAKGAALALAEHTGACYFLDFETIGDVVPRWAGTRAFEQIPFQFSLHHVGPRGGVKHADFLDTSGGDPRLALAKALVNACGTDGAVFAYNANFEGRCIADLAEHLANHRKLAKALLAIKARLIDLEPILRQHYYHPRQQGSWSLKAVLPALLPHLSYASLDGVQNGMEAQAAYLEAVDPATAPVSVHALRKQMLAYCTLDTLALVEIWRKLKKDQDYDA